MSQKFICKSSVTKTWSSCLWDCQHSKLMASTKQAPPNNIILHFSGGEKAAAAASPAVWFLIKEPKQTNENNKTYYYAFRNPSAYTLHISVTC